TARINTNYINSSTNRVQQGSNISGILLGVYRTPPDFNNDPYVVTYVAPNGATYLDQQRTYRDGEGSVTRGPGYNNPFWSINNDVTTYNTNRLFGTAEILYDPLKWANITYRAGVDYSTLRMNSTNPVGDASVPTGSLSRQALSQFQFNSDLIGTAQLEINEDFNGSALVGFHLDHRQTDNTLVTAQKFSLIGVPPTFSNAQNYFPDESKTILRTAALYGQLNLNMYNQLYLSLSGRSESASTYGPNVAQTYFYPSASAAWEFTKLPGLADNSILSYGKVRAAVGTAANQPPTYASGNYYNYGTFGNSWGPAINPRYYGGGAARSTVAGNKNLGPERTTEIEFGTELRFLQDRVTLSATQYFSKTTGAALQTDLAPSSGYSSIWQNAANISNIGTELQIMGEWLRLGSFSWTTTVNWFTNKNKVTDMPPGLESVFLNGFADPSSRAILNQSVGVLYGTRWERDANGNLALDPNGFPIMAATPGVIGDPIPKWRAGFINTFRYERFTLNVIFDIKKGGAVWNGTKGALSYFGTSGDQQWWTTLTADQASKLKNYWGLTPAEVINEGYKTYTKNADGSYSFRGYVKDFGKGPVLVDEMYFWDGPGSGFTGPAEQFVEDGSFVRLKEVSLSYTLPLQFFGFQSVTFTAIGRNLKLWTNYSGVDPETNLTGASNGQGLDYFNNPSARTFVFSVQINY
ncbi:MAG: TonB-dependent receptor, partial [Bacteroidota bacterium]